MDRNHETKATKFSDRHGVPKGMVGFHSRLFMAWIHSWLFCPWRLLFLFDGMRIRTIKPEFFLHHDLFNVEKETGLPVRLAFIGLWCAADREGRFKLEPERLKVQILPYDSVDFSRVLDALTTRGFIVKYASQGVNYACIPSFKRHQVINNRERQSELPGYVDCIDNQGVDASATRGSRVHEVPLTCTSGREWNKEGKGKEGNKTPHTPQGGVAVSQPAFVLLDLDEPDPEPEPANGKELSAINQARVIIAFLNGTAGRNYHECEAHLKPIMQRLKEVNGDIEGVQAMIVRQVKRWGGDARMSEFLRPETLFNKTKFHGYYDTRNLPVIDAPAAGHPSGRSVPDHSKGF